MKIQHIIWEDATGGDGWENVKTVKETTLATSIVVGFLVKEDKKTVTLTMGYFADDHDDELGAFLVIPKINIIKRRTVKI